MLNKKVLESIFEKLLSQAKKSYDEFNAADGKIGDGDLGVTILNGLEEINMLTETHTEIERIDIAANQRFYTPPNEMVKMIDIRVKNHLNSKGEYRTIPRTIHKPIIKDADGN